MKNEDSIWSRARGIAGGVAAVLLAAACGREPEAVRPAAAPEVRGEPIAPMRSEPLVASSPDGGAIGSNAPATVAVGAVAPAAVTIPAAPDATAGTADDPLVIGFDKLASFAYQVPDGPLDPSKPVDPGSTNQIPEKVRTLDRKFVSLKGFMLPLKVESGLVTELLIMRDQSMCCYGVVPKINEWVSVRMTGGGVKPVMDQAVTLFGTLKVGEMYENGYLVGIYALDGERMAGPLDL